LKIGKLFVGWRSMPPQEAVEFGLSAHSSWRGLFIEWGDGINGFGLLLMTEERR
jgi:hypothetical protein